MLSRNKEIDAGAERDSDKLARLSSILPSKGSWLTFLYTRGTDKYIDKL
jgi:hypothetical protein